MPTAGSRLAGEREYAFKHVLIRDVAYSMLPKSVRCRKHVEVARVHPRARRRARRRRDRRWSPSTTRAPRPSASEAGLERDELAELQAQALEALEAAGDAAAASTRTREAFDRYTAALELSETLDPATVARIGEKQGDVALRLGRVDAAVARLGALPGVSPRARRTWPGSPTCTARSAPGSGTRGSASARSSNYQRGIDLLKDGPPCLELVRLYEEAASLYMHTGDNMLAIYASEKALRLAERLDEARAASRAHGIFGRVFGRIGDSEKARENLERSVALARESDRPRRCGRCSPSATTSRSPRPTTRAPRERLRRGARRSRRRSATCPRRSSSTPRSAQLAVYARRLGGGRARDRGQRRSSPSARACTASSAYPYSMRGVLLWRDGQLRRIRGDAPSARSRSPSRSDGPRSRFESLAWLANTLPTRGDYADADQALARALDLCERAGLIAQSVEATADRAVNAAVWGKAETAAILAEEAAGLAERLRYPVGRAASLEASGAAAAEPEERERLLTEAREAWEALGRPLDAERCAALLAGV